MSKMTAEGVSSWTPADLGMDAVKWAEKICELNPVLDREMMIGWFANAIMTARDITKIENERGREGEVHDAMAWAEVREIMHRIDKDARGDGPPMADDDILPLVLDVLRSAARTPGKPHAFRRGLRRYVDARKDWSSPRARVSRTSSG